MDLAKLKPRQKKVAEKVIAVAEKYGVPTNLALALAMQESSMGLKMDGGKGPKGVMMISNRLAKDMGINQLNDDQNIDAGIRYLKQHLDTTGNIEDALVAYHDGPNSRYFKGGDMSPAARNHIQKVKKYMGSSAADDNLLYVSDETDMPLKKAQSADDDFEEEIYTGRDSSKTPVNPTSPSVNEDDDEMETIYTGKSAEETQRSPFNPEYGPRGRGMDDVLAGVVGGTAVPAADWLREKQSLNRTGLYLQALNAGQRDVDKREADRRRIQEAYEKALAEAEQANIPGKMKGPGSGATNWAVNQYHPIISGQINDPLSQRHVDELAKQIEARELAARQKFPNQMPVAPGSILTTDTSVGSRQKLPPPPPPIQPQGNLPKPPELPPPLNLKDTEGYKVAQSIKGRAPLVNSGLGAIAGSQLYDAYQNAAQGNLGAAAQSGTSGLSALFGAFAKKPWMKALSSAVSAGAAFMPDVRQFLETRMDPRVKDATVLGYADGGLVNSPDDIARMRMQRAMMQQQIPNLAAGGPPVVRALGKP